MDKVSNPSFNPLFSQFYVHLKIYFSYILSRQDHFSLFICEMLVFEFPFPKIMKGSKEAGTQAQISVT